MSIVRSMMGISVRLAKLDIFWSKDIVQDATVRSDTLQLVQTSVLLVSTFKQLLAHLPRGSFQDVRSCKCSNKGFILVHSATLATLTTMANASLRYQTVTLTTCTASVLHAAICLY